MKVIIIDDEKIALDLLEHYLLDIKGIELVASYQDPVKFMQDIENLDFEVLFVDIQMPGIQGIDLAKEVKKIKPEVIVVFVTAYKDYAYDAYQVKGFDYIAKPITKKRLAQSIDSIRAQRGEVGAKEEDYYVQTFNEFAISKNDEILALKYRTRKVKELLAYLIHRYPETTNRDRLLLDVWGDHTYSRNFSELHSTVYRLRLLGKEWFGKDIVEVVSGMYKIRLNIKRDIDEINQILAQGKLSDAAMDKLINSYKGEYLAADNYDWAIKQRLELHRQVMQLANNYVQNKMQEDLSLKEEQMLERAINFLLDQDIYNEAYVDLLLAYSQGRDKEVLVRDAYEKFTKAKHVDREEEAIAIINGKYQAALG